MPSLRPHVSRGTSSRPYDRRSPTARAGPVKLEDSLACSSNLSRLPPPTLIEDANPNFDPDQDQAIPRDHPGLPTYADYKRIEAEYLHSLSPRKRDKALITQAMFDKIWDVLHQPEACTIETPQFRFWVRKMFSLSRPVCVGGWGMVRVDEAGMGTEDTDTEEMDLELERALGIGAESGELFSAVVLHENRPVAIVEQLYELFCYCHVRAGHGGRDKTCAVIRQHYSWVPKELTAQFVKACPTCALKRSGHGSTVVSMGLDTGLVVQRRIAQTKKVGVEEMPVSVTLSSLAAGNMGWPMTGGPLDPANPEPYGVRERKREREWLRVHEDTGIVERAPIESGSRMRSLSSQVPLESCRRSRVLKGDTSPFRLHDVNRSAMETTRVPQPFTVHENLKPRARTHSDPIIQEKRGSPSRPELPSLASALSNESLDESVNLTPLDPAGECPSLSPALRHLRLSGPIPIPCDTVLDLPVTFSGPSPPETYLFQIDPVLLSYDYPGMENHASESGPALSGDISPMPLVLSSVATSANSTTGSPKTRPTSVEHQGPSSAQRPYVMNATGTVCRLPRCGPSESDVTGFGFVTANGYSPAPYTTRSTCRCDPGGPLATLSSYSGEELDGPGLLTILTDA